MTQPLDIIRSSLRSIGALGSGEVPDSQTAQDCLYLLNEMLDQWSNERIAIPAQQEVIHEITGGQYIYTLGPGGSVGCNFTGYITPNSVAPGGTLTVTAVNSGALSVGQIISSSSYGTAITGTAITALGSGTGGNNTATPGTYAVQQSQTFNVSCAVLTSSSAVITGSQSFAAGQPVFFTNISGVSGSITANQTYYVISTGLSTSQFEVSATLGGAAITFSATGSMTCTPICTFQTYAPRPLRINSALVRVVTSVAGYLDYPVAVLNIDEYQLIGLKTMSGPWPRCLYYQPTMPTGTLYYWPNPSQGEMHIFCETVINQFQTLSDTVIFPQGVQAAIHWNLAKLLLPEWGKTDADQVQLIMENAKQSMGLLKRTNMAPQEVARFDDAIQMKARSDAGFVLHGGFA